jgi:hypothetical protein
MDLVGRSSWPRGPAASTRHQRLPVKNEATGPKLAWSIVVLHFGSPTHFLEARFWIASGFADNPPIWAVPCGGTTLDLIGTPGSNRDFFGAVVCFLVQLLGKNPPVTGFRCENGIEQGCRNDGSGIDMKLFRQNGP